MFSVGRIDMGLDTRTLEDMTMAEFMSDMERYNMKQEKADRRVGRICATVMNAATAQINIQLKKKDKIKKTYKEEDFMAKKPFKPKKPQKTEDMIKMAEVITAALGGEDRRQMPCSEK